MMMVDDGGEYKEEGTSNNNDKKMNLEEAGETWSNMVLNKLLRPARYFDPPDDVGSMTDSSCEEQEHTKTSKKRCFICASFEHVGEHCSMGHDYCPNDGSVCLRCGALGHDMSLCKYEYSEDDMKDVQCYICKSFGHMCCVEPCDSLSWAVSCYKCGKLGHVGLGCGRHYEEPATFWGKRDCSSRLAEKKRRRLAKALARDRLEKKKQRKLEEQQHQHSTLHDGNFEEGSSSHQTNGKKIDENSELHSTLHESNGKKNDGNSEEDSTIHESNGKANKDNVEWEQNVTKEEEEDIREKSNHRSSWITEDLEEDAFKVGKHQEAEFSHYTFRS